MSLVSTWVPNILPGAIILLPNRAMYLYGYPSAAPFSLTFALVDLVGTRDNQTNPNIVTILCRICGGAPCFCKILICPDRRRSNGFLRTRDRSVVGLELVNFCLRRASRYMFLPVQVGLDCNNGLQRPDVVPSRMVSPSHSAALLDPLASFPVLPSQPGRPSEW